MDKRIRKGKINVDCIFFWEGKCRIPMVFPPSEKLQQYQDYIPPDDVKEQFCKSGDFAYCPRFKAYMDLLKALKE